LITYEDYVKPFGKGFQLVKIDDATIAQIHEFTTAVIAEKKKENHHQLDNKSHYKRYYTGTLGEVALEQYLNVTGIVDWSVGNSQVYHKPDMNRIGVNAGVKTVDYGLFPVIFKQSYSNEIIMIRWKENYVYICGLATKTMLNTYQSVDLIKDERLRTRGTKTGFYGFEHLLKFSSLEELKKLC